MSEAWKRAKIVTAVSNIFLYVLDRSFSTETNSGSAEHQKKVIETIMRHMEENIGNSQNLDKLARIAGYSKYHFFRMFKEYTGHTVHAYVNQCRIKALKRMRKEGMLQKNIASALGFSCPAAFANWQRKKLD